jgi:serine/threonine protein kinase
MQGTVFWMAPEVINTKKKGYNFKIDIWSVGCVVLEMWAGMRPWMGDEAVAVMFKVFRNFLHWRNGVSTTSISSSINPNYHRQCLRMSFYQSWLMISDANALRCACFLPLPDPFIS